jgi:hypothetical protein
MKAGKTGTREDQMLLDNSFRGLPWKQRRITRDQVRVLETHQADLPEPEVLVSRFLFADTQDNGWFWVVRGIDASYNTYKLGNGFVRSEDELAAVWDADYHGGVCTHGIIDAGGHADRPRVVKQFVLDRSGLFMYKGNSRIGTTWKYAKDLERYILANPIHYKAELLHLIYAHDNRSTNYWFLPWDIDKDYTEHICCFKPDNKVKDGHLFEKWAKPASAPDHYFDCEKMGLVLIDAYKKHMEASDGKAEVHKQRARVSYTDV